jgi:membrane fusion protein (multidrug efflux system)
LPLDVIIGYCDSNAGSDSCSKRKKVFISDFGKAEGSHGRNCNKNRCFPINFIWLKAGDTVITSGVMALKNETPVKVIIII